MPPVDRLPTRMSAWHRGWRRLLAVGALRLSLFALVWGVLVGGFAWLGGSEAGLRWAGARLTQASGGQLQIDGLGGRLLGDWHAQSLRWRDADQTIRIGALRVSWSPLALTRGELRLTRLEAADVRLAFAAPGEDVALPDELGLPFALRVDALRVDRLWVGQLPAADAPAPVPAQASPRSPSSSSTASSPAPRVPPGEGVAWLVADALEARLVSDGATHRVESLRARLGRIDLTAQASLEATAPFALTGAARLHATAGEQDYALALDVGGTLGRVRVDGRASVAQASAASVAPGTNETDGKKDGARAAGEVHATLEPFAPAAVAPLEALQVRLSGVDPRFFAAAAPHARIDVELTLARAAATLAGHVRLHNRDAGRIDGERLPVVSLASAIAWQASAVRLDGLAVALAGGGTLAGQGRVDLAQARFSADLAARRVDARALHAALPATGLAGPLRVQLAAEPQRLDLDCDWRDARYAFKVSARADAQAIDVAQLQVGARGAGARAQVVAPGRRGVAGDRRFPLQGRLRDVDAAGLLAAARAARGADAAGFKARGVLNADFEAHGAWGLAPEVVLHFSLDGSRVGTQSLSGGGDVDWSGGRLRRADVDVQAAGNRLRASGAGEALKVVLDAPQLGALGWPALNGALNATLDVVGGGSGGRGVAAADAELAVRAEATRLRVGEWFDGASLSLDARLAAGAQGALALDLRCSACAAPAYGGAPVTLELAADGVRAQHRVRMRVALPQRRELSVRAEGELNGRLFAVPKGTPSTRSGVRAAGPQATPGRPSDAQTGGEALWRGRLAELRFLGSDGRPLVELAAPAPLTLSADRVSFGPASLSGRLGSVSLERLAYDGEAWQSSGRLRQFRPQEWLSEFASLHAWRETLGSANVTPLELAGEWNIDGAPAASPAGSRSGSAAGSATPAGRAALWLERGDLALGTVALGLAQARVQASFGDGRLEANASVRGARAGTIGGEVSWTYPASGSPALIDRNSPWQGRVRADVPDLAWLAALLGDGWQVAGQARGELRLAGSAAHPEVSGQLHGERLALRALDLGMRLERGEAALDVTPQRLRLSRLRFESELAPLPRALRLDGRVDGARLLGTPGVVEASGELSLLPGGSEPADGEARLAVRFDRFGLLQRADQWVAVSGEGELRLRQQLLEVAGKLRADAAFWALADVDRPALSDDVVLRSRAGQPGNRVGRAVKVDLALALGNSAYFRGAGVDSRLAGALRIRSDDAGLPRATGSIRTVDGRFDAYGQQLEIERGIVNFQGPIDNPGLNLLAVRKNLPVEAGVEVGGTAQRPVIQLVSSPNVPDAEKLSWLVLGRSPEQQGGDGALLLAAAQTIVGGQDGGVLRRLQRALGIDEFGVSTGQVGGYAALPTSRVASASGFGASQTVNGQIVTVGKRLSSNAVLSYQQSLNTTESIVKLTLKLSRQFSLVGSAGADSALDFYWTRSFGK